MDARKKTKVLFEQYAIPHYRVPFFNELAKKVDLVVIASKNPQKGGGVNDVRVTPGFRSIRLDADPSSGLYHPGIIDVIKSEAPEATISFGTSLRLMLRDATFRSLLAERTTRLAWMGCDGYEVRNFAREALFAFLPWRLVRNLRDFLAMRQIDQFIAYSSHTRDYWKRVKWIPSEKITVAHNAIDTSIVSEASRASREERKPGDPRGIIFVGRLVPRKNIETLLSAVAKLSSPEATLTIVGEGPLEQDLKALAKRLDIEERVRFLGGIYDERSLGTYLSQSTLFVLPGVGGLSLNTAMAAGLPIIHTFADGTEKDLVMEGVNGWFFDGSTGDLAKKIDRALSDPAALSAMGEESKRRITEIFTLGKMVAAYLAAIEKMTQAP